MSKIRSLSFVVLFIAVVLAIPTYPAIAQGVSGKAETGTKVIQTQETNFSGVVAELTECKRKEGVLSIKVRFRNTSDASIRVYLYGAHTRKGEIDKFYVTGDSKKYFTLKDTEQEALASEELDADLKKNETHIWWVKFPAPPAEVKKINLIMPKVTPFEDVPITEAP